MDQWGGGSAGGSRARRTKDWRDGTAETLGSDNERAGSIAEWEGDTASEESGFEAKKSWHLRCADCQAGWRESADSTGFV